ncbi:MAG: hypothetical protein M1829_000378 [Trizodia sp. TS-e1964]|nr:MAG: hypothetical protein M1829_000378 [Trizodia sp. TS-e1964]
MKLKTLIFFLPGLLLSSPTPKAHATALPPPTLPKREANDGSGALLPDGGILIFYDTDAPSATSRAQRFTRTGTYAVTIDVRSAVFRMKYPKCTVDYPPAYDPQPGEPSAYILNSVQTFYRLRWIKRVQISCSTVKSGPLEEGAKGARKERGGGRIRWVSNNIW